MTIAWIGPVEPSWAYALFIIRFGALPYRAMISFARAHFEAWH